VTDSRVSLAYAAHCLREGKPIESDSAKPLVDFMFAEREEFFEPLIAALQSGKIQAQGRLSINLLDRPELDYNHPASALSAIQEGFRWKPDILARFGSEKEISNIPADSWWYEGVIWEKSILWVRNRQHFATERLQAIKLSPVMPHVPDRPYTFEHLVCFDDLTLLLNDIVAWANENYRDDHKPSPTNSRNAGRPPTQDWSQIEKHLQERVEAGGTWHSWYDVWISIPEKLRTKVENAAPENEHKKLPYHLKKHNSKLLEGLKSRIRTVQQRRLASEGN
jgi:hypothetical protein